MKKRPTQFDVARKAGVSRSTVSFVLNDKTGGNVPISDETRQRVLEAIDELGYVPDARARALRSGDTKTLGLIIPDIRNPHFWEIAEQVEQEARDAGYHLLVSNIALKHEHVNDIFNDLVHRRIDGLILMGSFTVASEEAKASLKKYFKQRLPIVELSDHYSIHHAVDRVSSNYYAATMKAMSYLFNLNHHRIGFLFGSDTPELIEDRFNAYRESLRAAKISVDEDLIIQSGPTIEDGYRATLRSLDLRERPTAIIAINDLLAMGAIRAVTDSGMRIPEDISLIGFDDIAMAKYMVPRLTTVSKDVQTLGRNAVQLLLSRLQDPDRPYQIAESAPQFIIRESTGPSPF